MRATGHAGVLAEVAVPPASAALFNRGQIISAAVLTLGVVQRCRNRPKVRLILSPQVDHGQRSALATPTMFRVLLTIAWLFLSHTSAEAGQSSQKPPANDDCLACHGNADAKRANGTLVAVDAPAFASSKHGPMACVDRHADLETLTEFPTQTR